jgi:hypothetical protein
MSGYCRNRCEVARCIKRPRNIMTAELKGFFQGNGRARRGRYCGGAQPGEILIGPELNQHVWQVTLAEPASVPTKHEGNLPAYRLKRLKRDTRTSPANSNAHEGKRAPVVRQVFAVAFLHAISRG